MAAALAIDGSLGEGGGQVLRAALALSVLTGQPFHIAKIRARRPKPGLMPQHLKAVEAAASVCGGRAQGVRLGVHELDFTPGPVAAGRYRFHIGTAGAISLVLQTVFLPLSFAGQPSQVTITGGTHVPWSPCHHYLEMQWLPAVARIGFRARLRLEKAGFYPRGGGSVRAEIDPPTCLMPLDLTVRGPLRYIHGLSGVCNLDPAIAGRQRVRALERLRGVCDDVEVELATLPGASQGTVLLLFAQFAYHSFCCFALGERGKRAERVADEAVDELLAFLRTDGVVDRNLADQLLLPLAVVPGTSEMRTSEVTQHLLTLSDLLPRFLPVRIRVEGDLGSPGTVRITGTELVPRPDNPAAA
jgi:RNA 3'-terminal phosphate cyclase (ATP)